VRGLGDDFVIKLNRSKGALVPLVRITPLN